MGKRRTPMVPGSTPRAESWLQHAVPATSVDLHGLRTEPARRRFRAFLQRVARQYPGQAVRVITGRGLNSPDGPKLRPMVLEELVAAEGLVSEWVLSADRGSVLIRLAGKKTR